VPRILTVSIIVLTLYAGSLSVAARAETTSGDPQLTALIDESLDRNPDLKAAKARWQSFSHKIVPAASLDDPRLSLGLNNYPVDTFASDQTPMTGETVRLTQMLPFPGKLAAKKEIAAQQAAWYEQMYKEARIGLARQVKESWYSLFFLDRSLEQVEASLKLLDDLVKLTEDRYATGKGIQQDVLKAQVERSIMEERRMTLVQQHASALAALNALRNQPADNPVTPSASVFPEPLADSVDQLLQKAIEQRPQAEAYRALIGQYQAQKKLDKLNFLPDFSVGAAYTFRQQNPSDRGVDFASVEFGLTLPLFRDKREENAAETIAAETMAREQLNDFINRTRFAICDASAQMEKNAQLVSLYDTGIIPQARQNLEAAISGYKVGNISVLSLLDTTLTLYRYEIEYYRSLGELGKNIARLQAEAALDNVTPSSAGQSAPASVSMLVFDTPKE